MTDNLWVSALQRKVLRLWHQGACQNDVSHFPFKINTYTRLCGIGLTRTGSPTHNHTHNAVKHPCFVSWNTPNCQPPTSGTVSPSACSIQKGSVQVICKAKPEQRNCCTTHSHYLNHRDLSGVLSPLTTSCLVSVTFIWGEIQTWYLI